MNQHTTAVATDGSSSSRRGSGWAWVTDSGHYSTGICGSSLILVAELMAIADALASLRDEPDILVLSDCRPALDMIARTLESGVVPDRRGRPGCREVATTLGRILRLARGRNVRFEWVRAHADHPLNDVADRLAVQTRRSIQLGGSVSSVRPLLDRIASEVAGA